ncbi:permease-like cell division protein FtsX [Oceanospirillaceae bacterium]|nr:permease-like cell division protein FtsX [Oceanospirillaceae bacterium]
MAFFNKPPTHNASRTQPESASKRLLREHKEVLVSSWERLWRTPLSNLLTWLTVAIALALPAALMLLLSQASHLGQQVNQSSHISVFLSLNTTDEQGQLISRELATRPDIAKVSYLSAAQALIEFKSNSGLEDILSSLTENPLPATILIEPTNASLSPHALKKMTQELRLQDNIDQVLVDMAWLDRLQSLLLTSQRFTYSLALLLALGVLLVVGNTVRLHIESRREEILVIKLVGGTDAYLRRPFLYAGFWTGLFSALIAWIILQLGVIYLHQPLLSLAQSYQSDWQLQGLNWMGSLSLIAISCSLSVLGAGLAVRRQLNLIEPK